MTCYFFRLCWTEAYFTQCYCFGLFGSFFLWQIFLQSIFWLMPGYISMKWFIFGGHTISEKYFKLEFFKSTYFIVSSEPGTAFNCVVIPVSNPNTATFNWTTHDCSNMTGVFSVCHYPYTPLNTTIQTSQGKSWRYFHICSVPSFITVLTYFFLVMNYKKWNLWCLRMILSFSLF